MIATLRQRVGRNIARHGLWAPGQRVLVAVSGGMDSMVLLDTLFETRRWHGGRLTVATVDHGLRPDAARDVSLVASVAAERGLPVEIRHLSLDATDEQAARDARYAALAGIPHDVIALGHHQRDQAETLLIQLLRGTGLGGAAGMAWSYRDRVRPLLDVPFDDLRGYAEARSLRWRDDPTNLDPRHLRNRVRRELLPLAEQIRPGATASLARSAEVLAADVDFLDEWLATEPSLALRPLPRVALADAPPPLARLAVRRAFPGVTRSQIDAILGLVASGDGVVHTSVGRIEIGDTVRQLPP